MNFLSFKPDIELNCFEVGAFFETQCITSDAVFNHVYGSGSVFTDYDQLFVHYTAKNYKTK